MKNINEIKIGTKFEFELIDSLGGKIGGTYTSQLLEIKDLQNISIAAPIQESKLMLVPTGSNVRCYCVHNKEGLISFIGSIKGKERIEPLIALNVNITSKFYQIQRRDHFRLDHMMDIKYRLLKDLDNSSSSNPDIMEIAEYKNGYTKNLSGTGACIISREPVEKGSDISLLFNFGKGTAVEVKCRVVRCFRMDDFSSDKYNIGLLFTDIPKREQEVIIKFIFEKQAELLRKKKDI